MFNWKKQYKNLSLIALAAISCATMTTACSSNKETAAVPTPQGTIALDAVRVGMPETTFKDAILTFVQDPNGSVAGKVQYLSRGRDANGGQYMVQCKDGRCFGLLVYQQEQPLSKEQALATLEKLFPTDKPTQSKVDDQQVKAGNVGTPTETIFFGDDYKGELIYTDKSASKVKIIAAWAQKLPS
ncbi:MAG: hypothetical protein K2Y22_05680 [Candidatus Obscuribacterales bacterium]|nr:hypothetical protein [Candidatus Obscuribacterales bacterium]